MKTVATAAVALALASVAGLAHAGPYYQTPYDDARRGADAGYAYGPAGGAVGAGVGLGVGAADAGLGIGIGAADAAIGTAGAIASAPLGIVGLGGGFGTEYEGPRPGRETGFGFRPGYNTPYTQRTIYGGALYGRPITDYQGTTRASGYGGCPGRVYNPRLEETLGAAKPVYTADASDVAMMGESRHVAPCDRY